MVVHHVDGPALEQEIVADGAGISSIAPRNQPLAYQVEASLTSIELQAITIDRQVLLWADRRMLRPIRSIGRPASSNRR
jgi:hypothetical protein